MELDSLHIELLFSSCLLRFGQRTLYETFLESGDEICFLLSEPGVQVSLLDDTAEKIPMSIGRMFENIQDISLSDVSSGDLCFGRRS